MGQSGTLPQGVNLDQTLRAVVVSQKYVAPLILSGERSLRYVPLNLSGDTVPAVDLDLFQGTLDLLILKTLKWGPRHGYAVASWIRETTGDRLQIEDGALYTALHRMEKRRWLEAEWGLSENNRKAKYYQLTSLGRTQLRTQTAVWTEYVDAVFTVLRTV